MKKIVAGLIIALLMVGCSPGEPAITEPNTPDATPNNTVSSGINDTDSAPGNPGGTEPSTADTAPGETGTPRVDAPSPSVTNSNTPGGKDNDQTVKPSANGSESPPDVSPLENPTPQADPSPADPSPTENDNDNQINKPFTVFKDVYIYEDATPDASISIEYLQISRLSDLKIQERINNMLHRSIIDFKTVWENDPEISDLKTYEIYANYTIIGNILSVQEMLSFYHSQAPYPWVALDSMTIDIQTGEKLILSDLLILSENLSDRLTMEIVQPIKIVIDEHDNDMMQELFYDRLYDCIEDGYQNDHNFYLTEETIGFIMEVPHAIGDYWTFEIAYDDLSDFLKPDFLWLLSPLT